MHPDESVPGAKVDETPETEQFSGASCAKRVCLATGTFSIGAADEVLVDLHRADEFAEQETGDARQRNPRSGASLVTSSFQGHGVDVTWDRAADQFEQEEGGGFVVGELERSILKDDEEEDGEEVEEEGFDVIPRSHDGNAISDKNVFALEVISNRAIRFAVAGIYLAFFAMLFVTYAVMRGGSRTIQLAVRPEDASGEDPVCWPRPDGLCEPNPNITADQAALLANTVIVSEGINATDWVGNRAKPGTPPFSALTIAGGAFMADPSVLEYSANPALHPFWDEISAVYWIGGDILVGDVQNSDFRTLHLDITLKKLDGDWPIDMADGPFPVSIETYSCVRGGENYCDGVGNWRKQLIHEKYNLYPTRKVEGSVYSARVAIYTYYIGMDVISSDAWRFVVSADPAGAVTDCLSGNKCVAAVVATGPIYPYQLQAWILLFVFGIYLPFFLWWISVLYKRSGWPPNTWPRENMWLLIMGLGHVIYVSMFGIVLRLCMSFSPSYIFRQRAQAAAQIMSFIGMAMQFFSLACFVDAPRIYVATKVEFYAGKVIFAIVCVICFAITVLYSFPVASGRDEPGSSLRIGGVGYGTAPEIWSDRDKIVASCSMLALLTCFFAAFIYYVWRAVIGLRVLKSLPFSMTRHTQLSFRFFLWATSFWLFGQSAMIITDIVFVVKETQEYNPFYTDGLDGLMVALNSVGLVALIHNIPDVLFSTAFNIIYQILFLPPSSYERLLKNTKTHYTSEEEMERDGASEDQDQEENASRKHLMVLDRARLLCTCSREAYLPFDDEERSKRFPNENSSTASARAVTDNVAVRSDQGPNIVNTNSRLAVVTEELSKSQPEEQPNVESSPAEFGPAKESQSKSPQAIHSISKDSFVYQGSFVRAHSPVVPLVRLAGGSGHSLGAKVPPGSTWARGCRVVARVYEPGEINLHDTRAIVFRRESSGDLIVAFRGTATTKHIKTDLMMQKVQVCLDTFLSERREKGVIISDLEKALHIGELTNVRLMDLLPSANDKELPDYLKTAHKAQDKIRGSGNIHFGFWSSYNRVRRELHDTIRNELLARPGRLLITGHSLGGALATLCAYDMCRWVVPTVKRQILAGFRRGRAETDKIHISCYTFGSPRVGGPHFAAEFNKVVPDTQRIVCDGDVITSGPPALMGYKHVGRENIFDFTGSIRVKPSLVEKRFSLKRRNQAASHSLSSYTKVIKKSFHPTISEEELLNQMREAYGHKRKST